MIDIVYTVCSSIEEARMIGENLIRNKYCACVNIIPEMESIYWWEGKIIKEKEVVLLLKTIQVDFNKIQDKIKELHSYEVPCIFSLSTENINNEYLNWMKGSIKS
tara:strand:- start:98 stop:412 length:315 start_codon:yes stop_codon:yes gene_type:complete